MRLFTSNIYIMIIIFTAGCASTIDPSSLKEPTNKNQKIDVRDFAYGGEKNQGSVEKAFIGILGGEYWIEYENEEGYFYRGPNLCVKIPEVLNNNLKNFPNSMFPGGVFIPKKSQEYRIYYYQFNINEYNSNIQDYSNSITANFANSTTTGVGAGLATGIINKMIKKDIGKIIVMGDAKDYSINPYVTRY